ncbi:hypothetical protein [Bacillus sp. B1-b2]|uniref:hypothetical protein n=1 Tax=Bacillus sp. B1-b2 TaxID=2653201 RepID=UPI001261938E|nr:hypothetical protein [Bacillus sp. B1-b2]KAB7665191.1 hypothetical protein F9279_21320 [Bacillus sp. B1-b2]
MYYPPYYTYNALNTDPQQNRIILTPIGGGSTPNFPPFGGGSTPSFPPLGGGFPPNFNGPQGGPPSPPPFDGPGGMGGEQGPPTSPPPAFTPQLNQSSANLLSVESGSMRPCLYRYTYVWLNNGRGFWFYPTFIGRNSVAGYRWRGNRWSYYGTDTNRIRSFQCN